MNKTDFIKTYNGKTFIRHIEGLRNKDKLKELLIGEIRAQNLDESKLTFDEACSCFRYEDRSFRTDKRIQDQEGIIVFKSKDYEFSYSEETFHGEIPKAKNYTDNSFYILDINGHKITYTAS